MSEDGDLRTGFEHVRVMTEGFDPTQDIQWLLNSDEVAEWLGHPAEYVEQLAKKGEIPARKLRGEWRFGIASLNLWTEGRTLGSLLKETVREAVQEAAQTIKVDGFRFEFEMDPLVTMEAMEKAYIAHVLARKDGNKTQAAEILEIDPSTLYRKIKRYRL